MIGNDINLPPAAARCSIALTALRRLLREAGVRAGSIIVISSQHFLYYIVRKGVAIRHGVARGKAELVFRGACSVGKKGMAKLEAHARDDRAQSARQQEIYEDGMMAAAKPARCAGDLPLPERARHGDPHPRHDAGAELHRPFGVERKTGWRRPCDRPLQPGRHRRAGNGLLCRAGLC
ncbi:MAG: hypothetical protein R3D61_11020 [Defluviimonas denitrificans]